MHEFEALTGMKSGEDLMFYLCFWYNARRLHARQRFKLVHVAENVRQRHLGSHFSVGRRIRCNNGTGGIDGRIMM